MGRRTQKILDLLQKFESQNCTFIDRKGNWPIVWERARGNFVSDVEGRKYVDLTAAFGVAAAGHANPRIVRAGQMQMTRLLHAMGDVHPHSLKAELAQKLSEITFERWSAHQRSPDSKRQTNQTRSGRARGKSIFCNSGFEAVEVALKTAVLATGKRGVIAFEGGYHGLGYGTLNVTQRDHFRAPFLSQIGAFGHFVSFPSTSPQMEVVLQEIRQLLTTKNIGAVLLEPVQARGGIRVPPPNFLLSLRRICDEAKTLLILDEIYTGFGRVGRWFACEHFAATPDLICLGKALTGGFPLSVCVGRAELMDAAWPRSTGEAIHTSTFLGHPVGCAMALAQIKELTDRQLPERAAAMGRLVKRALDQLVPPSGFRLECRGLGLLWGVELTQNNGKAATAVALRVIYRMLSGGYILLPEGVAGNVIALTPPLTISQHQLLRAIKLLQESFSTVLKSD